ncbi:uncharacterized protein TNCV_3506621 [Trichonephila clavipes]|uniref:Uncharacterized protein n=1 Tax=Trichonephila clavipes TaxID=2585209 RepID=A0A8X6V311_TRICX|nr:uncharacterized protein TNCV_3506621 [Trichonephila clavipes]
MPSECTRSTCSLNQWVRSLVGLFTSAGTGEYFPPLQFTCCNCGSGDRGRVAIYRPFGEVSLSLNRTVTCMVLKANDRRTSCPCHDEFRGPRSDYVRQVALATTTTTQQMRNTFNKSAAEMTLREKLKLLWGMTAMSKWPILLRFIRAADYFADVNSRNKSRSAPHGSSKPAIYYFGSLSRSEKVIHLKRYSKG